MSRVLLRSPDSLGRSHRPFSGVSPPVEQTPEGVDFDLEEALSLLAALEDSRDVLIDTDHLAVLSQVEHQIQILSRKLGLDQGAHPMSGELLRASEAARRLEMSTKELLRLVHGREIRYEMVDGIAHLPTDALEEYRARAS